MLNRDNVFDAELCALRAFANRMRRLSQSPTEKACCLRELVATLQSKAEMNLADIDELLSVNDEAIDGVVKDLLIRLSHNVSEHIENIGSILTNGEPK